MDYLQSLFDIISAFWQFFLNTLDAVGIMLSAVSTALPFMMSLVSMMPGIIGTSVLITLTVKVIEMLARASSSGSGGG